MRNLFIALALLATLASPAFAATGQLNPSYGTNGVQAFPAYLHASFFVTADDKITYLDGYDEAVARLTAAGPLDSSFGTNGVASNSTCIYPASVAVFADGSYATVGVESSGLYCVTRNLYNGSLDTAFGTGGIATYPDRANGREETTLGVQAGTGRLVSVSPVDDFSGGGLEVAGFNATGADPGYNAGSIAVGVPVCDDVLPTPLMSGDVLVSGRSAIGSGEGGCPAGVNAFILRLTPDGLLDTSFGNNGLVSFPGYFAQACGTASTDTYVQRLVPLPGGGFLALYYEQSPSTACGTDHELLYAFQANGTLNTSFAASGVLDLGDQLSTIDLELEPDQKLLLLRSSVDSLPTETDYELERLSSAGVPDTSFGPGGSVDVTSVVQPYEPEVTTQLLQIGGGLAFLADFQGSSGSGNDLFQIQMPSFNLQPAALAFTASTGVPAGSTQTSGAVTVSGLDAGVYVPVYVSGGMMSIDGAGFSTNPGWVGNGDTISLQVTASSTASATVTAQVTAGGLIPNWLNPNLAIGATTTGSYSVTTQASGSSSSSSSSSGSSSSSSSSGGSSGSSSSSSGGSSSSSSSSSSGSGGSGSSSSSSSGGSAQGGSGGGGSFDWIALAGIGLAALRKRRVI